MGYDIKSMTVPELKTVMEELGEKPFKAKQLYEWIHKKTADSYEEMTNLSKSLREKLAEKYPYTHLEAVEVQKSSSMAHRNICFGLPTET